MSEKNHFLLLNLDTVLLIEYTCRTQLFFREKFAKSILLSMLVKLRRLISDIKLGEFICLLLLHKKFYIWPPNLNCSHLNYSMETQKHTCYLAHKIKLIWRNILQQEGWIIQQLSNFSLSCIKMQLLDMFSHHIVF